MEIDCQSAREALTASERPLLLDCREQDEFELVHLEGSLLLPMSEIQQRVSELDASRNGHIIVYCHHGVRSLHVAAWLRQQGFEKAVSMTGGIDAWSLQIDPSLPRY